MSASVSSSASSPETGARRLVPAVSKVARRLTFRLLMAELLLTLLEVALVGTPMVLLVREGIQSSGAAPALLPWLGGLWLLSIVGSITTLRPVWTALGIKRRHQALTAAAAESVQAALRRAPIEAGRLRTAVWTITGVLLAVRLAHHGDLPWVSCAGVVTMASGATSEVAMLPVATSEALP